MKDTIIGAPVCQTIQTKLTGVAGPSSAAPLALACAPLARSAAPESPPSVVPRLLKLGATVAARLPATARRSHGCSTVRAARRHRLGTRAPRLPQAHNVDYNFATRGQNAFNLALHLGAVFNSRNTVGGVSWLSAALFDLTEEGWHGLPFSPRSTVMYDGTEDILLTEDEVAQHALARNLQCALTAEEQVVEGLRVLRAAR